MREFLVRALIVVSIATSFVNAGPGEMINHLPTGTEYKDSKDYRLMRKRMPEIYYNNLSNPLHKVRWKPDGNYNTEFPEYNKDLTKGYILGDFISIGNDIIKDIDNYYQVDSRFTKNSSSANLAPMFGVKSDGTKLPITKDDIVYARLYWEGEIFDIESGGSKYFTYGDFYKNIAGYRDITISVDGSAPITRTAKDEDTKVMYSYRNTYARTGNSYKNGYTMLYSASVDVTDVLRKHLSDGKITVGNINVSLDNMDEKYTGDAFEGGSLNYAAGYHFIYRYVKYGDYPDPSRWHWSFLSTSAGGSWNLVVVYHRPSKDKNGEKQDTFKPKSVTIFDGYSYDGISNSSTTSKNKEFPYSFDGFLTPDRQEYEAKASYYINAGAGGDDQGMYFKKKDGNWVPLVGELNPAGGQLNSSKTYLDIDRIQKDIDRTKGTSRRSGDMDSYKLDGLMGPKETKADLKILTSSKYNSKTNTTSLGIIRINNIVFSTDLYTPSICYVHDIYNAAGAKNDFTVVQGETILNRIRFENNATKDETAEGLVVNIEFNNNMIYHENTMRIDNSLTNSSNEQDEKKMKFIQDDTKGAYNSPLKATYDAAGNIIGIIPGTLNTTAVYKDRQFNSLEKGEDGIGRNLKVYIGEGAGSINAEGVVSGGNLKGGEKVFIDYNSTINSMKFEPNNISVSLSYQLCLEDKNGIERCDTIPLDYGGDNPIPACPDQSDFKKVKIFPLSGLRVVNQNFNKDKSTLDDYHHTNLYTQIAGKEFNTKFIYRVDANETFEKKADENGDMKFVTYDPKDGTEKLVTKEEAEIEYSRFDLPGKLELSLVTNKNIMEKGCKNLVTRDRVPFVFNNPQKNTYEKPISDVDYKNCTEKDGNQVCPINDNISSNTLYKSYEVSLGEDFNYGDLNDIMVDYVRSDYTFMITYYPIDSLYDDTLIDENGCLVNDKGDFIDKDGKEAQSCVPHTIDREIGSFSAGANIEGGFNVCNSDLFSVRPKAIKVNKKVSDTARLAGDPKENEDLNEVFYPINDKDAYVGGYDSNVNSFFTKTFDENSTYLKPLLPNECSASPVLVSNSQNQKLEDAKSNGFMEWQIRDENGILVENFPSKISIWNPNGVGMALQFAAMDKGGDMVDIDSSFNSLGLSVSKELSKEFQRYTRLSGKYKSGSLDERYALVYTDEYWDKNDEPQYEFNYYNIGEAEINVIDTSWTNVDQVVVTNKISGESKKATDDTAGCIIGESFYNADTSGRVGCNIGIEDDKPILKFKHERVDVNVTNFSDSLSRVANSGTADERAHNYTFYSNSGDMNATLDINVTAKLSDKGLYKDVVPTMYNSSCYARNVGFGIKFNFDCEDSAGVDRVNGVNRCASKNFTPSPSECRLNPLDSRCFTDGYAEPQNYKDKLLLGAKENSQVEKVENSDNHDINATREGFNDGINLVKIGVNFNRDDDTPTNPQIIYGEDFIQGRYYVKDDKKRVVTIVEDLTDEKEEEIEKQFKYAGAGKHEFKMDGIVGDPSKSRFIAYDRGGVAVTKDTIGGAAHFYYGNINSNIKEYPAALLRDTINANIYSMIYCNADSKNKSTPTMCLDENSPFSLFRGVADVIGSHRANFYRNEAEFYGSDSIRSEFVDIYDAATANDISINRSYTLDKNEPLAITYSGSGVVREEITLKTEPWFLHNPKEYKGDKKNFFIIEFVDESGWGGQGSVKSGDDVGTFLGDKDASKNKGNRNFNNRSINW